MAKAYKDWDMDDIIAYCQANKQVEWLKTTAAKTVKRPIYPKIPNITKTGKRTWVSDKKAEPIGYEETPITFVEIKAEFIETFIGKPKKEKKVSFYDRIAAL